MATAIFGGTKRATPIQLIVRAKPQAQWDSRRYRRHCHETPGA